MIYILYYLKLSFSYFGSKSDIIKLSTYQATYSSDYNLMSDLTQILILMWRTISVYNGVVIYMCGHHIF